MAATRPWLGTAARLAAAWVALVVPLLLLGWLLTHPWESAVDPWDDDVVRSFAAERTSALDRVADVLTFLADTRVSAGLATVVAAALSWWLRRWRPSVYVGALLLGELGFYVLTTWLIVRQRPPVPILDHGLVPDDSFPSGHVANAVVVYLGLAVLLLWVFRRARAWAAPVWLLPLAVALVRVYQAAHHPTDVLASLVYATAWVLVAARVLLWGSAPERTARPARTAGGGAARSRAGRPSAGEGSPP